MLFPRFILFVALNHFSHKWSTHHWDTTNTQSVMVIFKVHLQFWVWLALPFYRACLRDSWFKSDRPENCHLAVKNCQKLDIFSKKNAKNFHFFSKKIANGNFFFLNENFSSRVFFASRVLNFQSFPRYHIT